MKTVRARGLGIAFAVCGLAGAAGFAQAQSDSPSPCASITDDKSRLQCYDAEHALKKSHSTAPPSAPASPAAAASSATPAPAPSAAPVPAPSATPVPAPAPRAAETAPTGPAASGSASEFGSETLPKKRKPDEAEEASEITATVASVSGKRKGDYRITLDNGQVWAESQRTGGEPPAPGDTVILRRGMMGSYFLSKGSGLALRVTRVK